MHISIFSPLTITPLNDHIVKIYRPISSGAKWTRKAAYFIANPYQLIIATEAYLVYPLSYGCMKEELTFHSNNTIKETYIKNDNPNNWFLLIFEGRHYKNESPGRIRLWMTNAYDAGFHYAHVDMTRSKNIDPAWNDSPENIKNAIYSQAGLYHLGRNDTNNISPGDINGRIKLLEPRKHTIIYVKLWRDKPKNTQQKESFAYIIELIPSEW